MFNVRVWFIRILLSVMLAGQGLALSHGIGHVVAKSDLSAVSAVLDHQDPLQCELLDQLASPGPSAKYTPAIAKPTAQTSPTAIGNSLVLSRAYDLPPARGPPRINAISI